MNHISQIVSWDEYFCNQLMLIAMKSKDPSTQAGCIIVGHNHEILSTGFNGMPRGILETYPELPLELQLSDYDNKIFEDIKETVEARYERPEKYKWFEHAERNAIYNAARIGTPLDGSILYVNGWPCTDCARAIIQVGITEVIIYDTFSDDFKERWKDDINRTKTMFEEADIDVSVFNEGELNIFVRKEPA